MKKLESTQFVKRFDGTSFLYIKDNKNKWLVFFGNGKFTGYKFNSFKKPKEYCLYGL